MTKHKSHHIFAYLGVLTLVFIVIFGVRYFNVEYRFDDVEVINNSQAYEEGTSTKNPFIQHVYADFAAEPDWSTVGTSSIDFAYPRKYQLMMGTEKFIVSAPFATASDCEGVLDEQERAGCFNSAVSPYITIDTKGTLSNPFTDDIRNVVIDGIEWQRKQYSDEYGGFVSFSRENIELMYEYTDVDGGVSFETLHNDLGEQYQLSQVEQEQLARNIISTIKVK